MASFEWPIVFYFDISEMAFFPDKHLDNAVLAFGKVGGKIEVCLHCGKKMFSPTLKVSIPHSLQRIHNSVPPFCSKNSKSSQSFEQSGQIVFSFLVIFVFGKSRPNWLLTRWASVVSQPFTFNIPIHYMATFAPKCGTVKPSFGQTKKEWPVLIFESVYYNFWAVHLDLINLIKNSAFSLISSSYMVP